MFSAIRIGLPARRFRSSRLADRGELRRAGILYELRHLDAAIYHASFYACAFDGAPGRRSGG